MRNVIKLQYDHKHKFQNKPPQYSQKLQKNKTKSGTPSTSLATNTPNPQVNKFSLGKPSLSAVNTSPVEQNAPRKTINSCSKFTSVKHSKEKARKMLNLRDSQASVTEGYNVPRDTRQIVQPRASGNIQQDQYGENEFNDDYCDYDDDDIDADGLTSSPDKMISKSKKKQPHSSKFRQQDTQVQNKSKRHSHAFSITSLRSDNNRSNRTLNSQSRPRQTQESISSTIPRNRQYHSSDQQNQFPQPFQAHFKGAITPNLDLADDLQIVDDNIIKIENSKRQRQNLEQNLQSHSLMDYSQRPPQQSDITHIQEMKSALYRLSQQRIGAQQQVQVLNTRINRAKDNAENYKKQIQRMRNIIADLKQSRMRTVKQNENLKIRVKQTTKQLTHALQNMLVLLEFFEQSRKISKQYKEDSRLLNQLSEDEKLEDNKTGRENSNLSQIYITRLQSLINKERTRLSMIAMHRQGIQKIIRSNKELFDKQSKLKNLDVSEELSPTDYRQIYSSEVPILKQPRNQLLYSKINETYIALPQSTTNATASLYRGFQTARQQSLQASKRLQFNGNSSLITSPQKRSNGRKNLNQSMYCRIGTGGNAFNNDSFILMNESSSAIRGGQNKFTCSNFNPNFENSLRLGRNLLQNESRSLSSSKEPNIYLESQRFFEPRQYGRMNQKSILERCLNQSKFQNSAQKKVAKNKAQIVVDPQSINNNMSRFPTVGQIQQQTPPYENNPKQSSIQNGQGQSLPYEYKAEQDENQYIESYLNQNDYKQQKKEHQRVSSSSNLSYIQKPHRLTSMESYPQVASESRNTKMQIYPAYESKFNQADGIESNNASQQLKMINQIQNQRKLEQKNNEIAQHLKKIQNLQKSMSSNQKHITQLNDKIKLMEHALCRANLQRQSTTIKLQSQREKNTSTLKQTQEHLNQQKQQNNRLHTELQFAQQRLYSYQAGGNSYHNSSIHSSSSFSPDRTKKHHPLLILNKQSQINSSSSEVSTVVAGGNAQINNEEINQLRNQVEELTAYKNKYQSSKEAISNLLSVLFTKFQQSQSKAISGKPSTPDTFNASSMIGQKQRDLLESLLSQSNFSFLSNVSNQMSQVETANIRLKKKSLEQQKKEIQLVQNLIDTYGGLAKIGQAFSSNNEAQLSDIRKELIQQVQPLQEARDKKIKEKEKLFQNYRRKKKQVMMEIQENRAKGSSINVKNGESNISTQGNMLEYLVPNNRDSKPPSVRGHQHTSIQTDYGLRAQSQDIKEVSEDDYEDEDDFNLLQKNSVADSKIIEYEEDPDNLNQKNYSTDQPKIVQKKVSNNIEQSNILTRDERISKQSSCSSRSYLSQDQNFSLQIDYETLDNSRRVNYKSVNNESSKNSIAESTRRMASPEIYADREKILALESQNQELREKIKQLELNYLQERESLENIKGVNKLANTGQNEYSILKEDLVSMLEIQSISIQNMLNKTEQSSSQNKKN